MKLKRTK